MVELNINAAATLSIKGNESKIETLNVKAAATISIDAGTADIKTMNLKKDVKLAEFTLAEGTSYNKSTIVVNKGVTYKEDGSVDNAGTTTTDPSDYITDGKITVSVPPVTLTGYSTVTSGSAATFKFSEAEEGYPEHFDISNYSKVTVNFKLYDGEDNVIKEGTNEMFGKLCLNGTSLGDKYNGGYGNGLNLFYLANIGRFGNAISEEGITSLSYDLTNDMLEADCFTCQVEGKNTVLAKAEIISIVFTPKE